MGEAGDPKPWIDPRQFDLIVSSLPDDGTLVEWGSGGSTIELRRRKPNASILSFETDPEWAQITSAMYVEPDPDPPNRRLGPMHDSVYGLHRYIHEPPIGLADVILIDGFARSACLLRCVVEKVPGTIWFHDSDEEAYRWMIGNLLTLGLIVETAYDPTPDYSPHTRLSRIHVRR